MLCINQFRFKWENMEESSPADPEIHKNDINKIYKIFTNK